MRVELQLLLFLLFLLLLLCSNDERDRTRCRTGRHLPADMWPRKLSALSTRAIAKMAMDERAVEDHAVEDHTLKASSCPNHPTRQSRIDANARAQIVRRVRDDGRGERRQGSRQCGTRVGCLR